MTTILRWFSSKTVRRAVDLRKHVLKLLNHQRDVLAPKAIEAVEKACAGVGDALKSSASVADLRKTMEACEEDANKWLKPYPHSSIRENVELFLVAIAVAMAIRTFFIQPFKIPTGSMQPTLMGITSDNLMGDPDFRLPSWPVRMWDFWVTGISYFHEVAQEDGQLERVGQVSRVLLFNFKQDYWIAGVKHTIYFPDDTLFARAGLQDPNGGVLTPARFKRGDDIMKLKVMTGDHLFVDRFTYNFRRPARGDIIVFETHDTNIEVVDSRARDTCYIKRLVGLGGETLRIGNDRHIVVNGTNRLDASTPHFESVYSFDPKLPPQDSHYSGHLNGIVAARAGRPGLAPNFQDERASYNVRPNHYLPMGDNTMSSSDSRTWGDIPQERVIGRSSFVYWPINFTRFGFGYR